VAVLLPASALIAGAAADDSYHGELSGSTQLLFSVQPPNAAAGVQLSPAPQVTLRDSAGTVAVSGVPITLALLNPSSGVTLSGTLTISTVNGVATFSDLSVNIPATGLVLLATSGSLPSALSNTFSSASDPLLHSQNHLANLIIDGSFEQQATIQNVRNWLQPSGARWGAAWTNWGWSSWSYMQPGGAWSGGGVAFSEDFTTGWKWAHTGDTFGIVGVRSTMSQTFTADEDSIGTLSWFDANRSSWREHTWFGRPNDYSVTITDALGNVLVVGNYTSQVFLGLEENSWVDQGDDRFSLAGKQGWFSRSGAEFSLSAGMTYTLSFNSLSPYIYGSSGEITGADDRVTFVDDIVLTTRVAPTPTATATATPTATATQTSTATPTATATPTSTATATPTVTPVPTVIPTTAAQPTQTPAATPTETADTTTSIQRIEEIRGTASTLLTASRAVTRKWGALMRQIQQNKSCRAQMRVGCVQIEARRWQRAIQLRVQKKLLTPVGRCGSNCASISVDSDVASIREMISAYNRAGQKLTRMLSRCSGKRSLPLTRNAM
jgi:hypothetical protein